MRKIERRERKAGISQFKIFSFPALFLYLVIDVHGMGSAVPIAGIAGKDLWHHHRLLFLRVFGVYLACDRRAPEVASGGHVADVVVAADVLHGRHDLHWLVQLLSPDFSDPVGAVPDLHRQPSSDCCGRRHAGGLLLGHGYERDVEALLQQRGQRCIGESRVGKQVTGRVESSVHLPDQVEDVARAAAG